MDSPCIKQTVCKVLKIFQYGKYLVAYVLKWFVSIQNVFGNTKYCEQQHMKVITGSSIVTNLIEIYCNVGNPQLFLLMHRSGGCFCWAASISHWVDLTPVSIYIQYIFEFIWSDQILNYVRCLFTVLVLYIRHLI